MIIQGDLRKGYIGGSDINIVYGNYHTPSFKKWWAQKLTGFRHNVLKSRDLNFGTIMEGMIADHLNIPKDCRDLKVSKPNSLAGANTDAIINGKLIEIKTMKKEKVDKIEAGGKMNIGYRRQVYHTLWCSDLVDSVIYILSTTEDMKKNPWAVDIGPHLRKFDFPLDTGDFDITEHEYRMNYLTFCYERKLTPTNPGLDMWRMR